MLAMIVNAPGGLENVVASDIAEPPPVGKGEVLLEVHASSLNFHDYAVGSGMFPVGDGRILLSDAAGEISAVGEGVEAFAVGDAVMSTFYAHWEDGTPRSGRLGIYGDELDGFARKRVVLPATSLTRSPKGYSHLDSASFCCAGLTAWRGLISNGRLKPGEQVLVQGSGGVSVFALQIAKAMGAHVIATSSSDEKLEWLRSLGADQVVNYRTTPAWGDVVRKLSGGGVDHVIDVGGPATLPQSIAAVCRGGHIAFIGLLSGSDGPIPTTLMLRKEVRLIAVSVGSRQHQREMVRGIEGLGIKPWIDRVFPLDQLADALRYQQSGTHRGKIGIAIR
ncbi:zinc-dependent alcohol dehydrogenase family protein [Sphingobium sp.]|uniref:zinc-dependent alcohol dehydrogenase family protein n=1 Tax=Sphingobium sp. TaxID=1912891 RepID=UPI003BB6E8BB